MAGWPISHSKSPILHGYWLAQYAVEGSYEALAVEPDDFELFVDNLKHSGFCGGNITIPHKETAFQIIKNRDEAAEAIGAVNTIWIEEGSTLAGNTDAYGFSANLDDQAPKWRNGKVATVLGAGGASRAIIFALAEAGYKEIRIVNRTLSRAKSLQERFRGPTSAHQWDAIEELLQDCDLLVNTTSIGLNPQTDPDAPDLSSMKETAIVADIVYSPLITPLLEKAAMRDLKIVDGLGMLLHQAVPGFEYWFGIRPEVTAGLRNHVLGIT